MAEAFEQYRPDEEEDGIEDLSKLEGADVEMPEEFIDESNPFYVKKKEAAPAAGAAKPSQKDSSDAAGDILRKMMDRRKASRVLVISEPRPTGPVGGILPSPSPGDGTPVAPEA